MLKHIIAFALLGSALALAQAAEPAGRLTTENIIKRTLEGRLGGVKIEAVTKTPYLGLYEVRVDNEILYTDEKMSYIFSGNIIDAKSMQNLTEKRLRELSGIKWENLPLDAAVKQCAATANAPWQCSLIPTAHTASASRKTWPRSTTSPSTLSFTRSCHRIRTKRRRRSGARPTDPRLGAT
jgi:hypothetical protein